MTEQQKIHIAMINSFNVITGKATLDDIMDSNIPLFSHDFNEEYNYDNIMFITDYFSKIEMFEECVELQQFIASTFDKSGKHKEKVCECPYPKIEKYEEKTKCASCKMKIKR